MLCEVGSSFTTCSRWFARIANTCGSYMQPFWLMTMGWLGGSNVRSPRPSETNTITFSSSPFESAITSCENTGEGCCFAQLGSAAMLIAFGFCAVPSKRATPFTEAVLAKLVGRGLPALTTCWLEMQIANTRSDIETSFFVLIQLHLNSEISRVNGRGCEPERTYSGRRRATPFATRLARTSW